MKSILFPTDFSHNANRALEYAVEIAALSNSSVDLLHVYTPVVSKDNIVRALLIDEIGDATRESREKLEVICKTIQSEYPEVPCRTIVKVGETNDEILNTAREIKCDLIIMGTLGASNLTKMIFGSNTAAIIEQSDCPVMAVPQGCIFHPPKRILFSTNFSYNDLASIIKLAPIAEAFKSEIIIGHVIVSNEDEEPDELPAMKNFEKEAKSHISYPRIYSRVVNDHNITMGLDKIIEETEIDLFAISTHKRSWVEKISNPSLTKKISNYTDIPLLAFHNPVDEEQSGPDF